MAIVRKHVNARLRLTDEYDVVQTFNRVKPGISEENVSTLMQAIMMIRSSPIDGALMTVTEQLTEDE